ncbi:MAG: hypothetical protein U1E10_05100 [Bdellovibrionales bacterium]|nr:hypothetical protein [Bdellovibrionales bacterium]
MSRGKLISSTALLTVSFATFLFVAQAQTESPTPSLTPLCAPEQLVLKCVDHSESPLDLRKARSEADGVKFNYFLWGKREHHQELEKFASASSDTDQTRALALVDVARKYAIEYVTGGRDPSAWSIETRTIVDRIRKIEFRISDPYSSDCFEATDPGLPQAAYSPMEHAIGLCHSLVKTHSNVILATLLHEIGHAVSTCNMKKALLRHKELTSEAFSCLNEVYSDLGSTDDASEREDTDRTLARSISEIKLGLDVNATNTETMLRCGAVERVPNSSLENVRGNTQFDQCALRRFAKDYDLYVARFALGQDSLPRGLIEKEKNIVDKFKESNPQSCYRKSEEHFADTFAAQALALWHKSEKKNRGDFRLAVYDLAQTYCMGRLESRNVSNAYLYPADDVRLLSYLAPPHFQNQIGCANLPKPVCTLTEDPAGLTSSSPSRSSKRGTAK